MVEWTQRGPMAASTRVQPSGISQAPGAPAAAAAAQVSANLSLPGEAGGSSFPSPAVVVLGLALLLFGLKLVGESSKTDISPGHMHIGGYNVLTVTVTSIVGTVLLKYIFNKFHVPGVTDVLNAV